MRALLGFQQGNAQPGLVQRDLLELVEELRLLLGSFQQDVVGQREETAARPKAFQKSAGGELLHALGLLGDGSAQLAHVNAGHIHLPDLLFEGHSAEQVFHALFDRLRRVAVERLGLVRGLGEPRGD